MKSDKSIIRKSRYLVIGLLISLCYLPSLSFSDGHNEGATDDSYCGSPKDIQTKRSHDLDFAIKNILYSVPTLEDSSVQVDEDIVAVRKLHMCDGFSLIRCMIYKQDNDVLNIFKSARLYDRVAENDNLYRYTILTQNREFFPKSVFPYGSDTGSRIAWEGELGAHTDHIDATFFLLYAYQAHGRSGRAFGSGNTLLSVVRSDLNAKILNGGKVADSSMLRAALSEMTEITDNKIKIMSERRSKLESFLSKAKDDANALLEGYGLGEVSDENEVDAVELYQKIEIQTCLPEVRDLIIKVKNEVILMKKELSRTLMALENLNKRKPNTRENTIRLSHYDLQQRFDDAMGSIQSYIKPVLKMDDKVYSMLIREIKEYK